MNHSIVGVVCTAMVAFGIATTRGDEIGGEIDLTAFGNEDAETAQSLQAIPLQDVADRLDVGSRRFYLSGMIGPSFANFGSPSEPSNASSDTLFNAGGALGMALERQRGQLRLEVEGMGRSTYEGLEANGGDTTHLTSNWSVITNAWRDVMITDRFGVYGGGGIGGGGYRLSETYLGDAPPYVAPPGAAFAWQAGGGLLWQISDRLTFDVGYRYFQIDTIQQEIGVLPNQFAASEVMFSLRLYEPFRSWRGAVR